MAKRRRSNGDGSNSGRSQSVRDLPAGTEVQFEVVIDFNDKERHVAAAGIIQSQMSGVDAWLNDFMRKKKSGTVFKILIPAGTPMVDLKSGEPIDGLAVPMVVYKHRSHVREVK